MTGEGGKSTREGGTRRRGKNSTYNGKSAMTDLVYQNT